jgi:TonB family protein
MRDWRRAGLTGVVLPLFWSFPELPAAAQSEDSPPAAVRTAHLAVISNFSARCPELKRADPAEEAIAVVVFRVGVSGLPSQASIRTSSHSASLDAAATSCVMQLRFQPATSPGDGEAVPSWQQLALRWLRPSAHNSDASPTSAARAPTSQPASGSAPAPAAAEPQPHAPPAADARVDVRVCVDGSGRLVHQPTVMHSSGDAQFDAAALRIAQSASGSYRPATGSDPVSASACTLLTLSIEQR